MHIKGFHWATSTKIRPQLIASHTYIIGARDMPSPAISHDKWILDYSFTDGSNVKAGRERCPWKKRLANQAHLYAPRTKYWEHIQHDIRAGYIAFTDAKAAGVDRLTGTRGYARINDLSGKIGHHISEIADLGIELGEGAYWEAQTVFIQILGLLLTAEKVEDDLYSAHEKKQSVQTFSATVMAYLRMNYHRRLTLDEIAQAMHVSQSTLTHRFLKESGKSPIQALIEIRLDIARLLTLRGEKLDSIAVKTGFYDAFHLSKSFRKHYGVSPSRFHLTDK